MPTTIAKAYVQILPSTEGLNANLKRAMDPASEQAGTSAGNTAGSAFSAAFKVATAAAVAGLAAAVKAAFTQGAALEQSLGGVRTIYEQADAWLLVEKNAKQAYATAGLSANEYMEQATMFGAALVQGLGGDALEAAKVADMALQDMADNANKFGTNVESIQTAYQSFARNTYTLLDNLRLGYGGTKSEMERLLADAQAITGVEYDITKLSDVYNAIHVIQENLGVTGTTAQEAEKTFSGSFKAMRASAQNVLGALATGGDLSSALGAFADTSVTFFSKNLIPMLENILSALPGALSTVLTQLLPQLVTSIARLAPQFLAALIPEIPPMLKAIISAVVEAVPVLVEGVVMVVGMLAQELPTIVESLLGEDGIPKIIKMLCRTLIDNLPALLMAVTDLVLGIVDELPFIIQSIISVLPDLAEAVAVATFECLPQILAAVVQIAVAVAMKMPEIMKTVLVSLGEAISNIVRRISERASEFKDVAKQWIGRLWEQIRSSMAELPEKMVQKIGDIIAALVKKVQDFINIGKNLVSGLWNGISAGWSWLVGKVKELAKKLISSVKKVLGISSPSREFMAVGEFITEGLAKGLSTGHAVQDAMDDVMGAVGGRNWDGLSAAVTTNGYAGVSVYGALAASVAAISEKLDGLQIVMDSGALVGAVAEKMDRKLGGMSNLTARGATV